MLGADQSSGSGGGSGPEGLAVKKKGLLDNATVAQLLEKGINAADAKYSCEDLFGSLTGAALLDAIYDKFGAGEHDVAWYTKPGDGGKPFRNVVRSSLSRPIQESTCANYMQRMYKEGLSQFASGHLAVEHATVQQHCNNRHILSLTHTRTHARKNQIDKWTSLRTLLLQ